jgi:hypothetical protein
MDIRSFELHKLARVVLSELDARRRLDAKKNGVSSEASRNLRNPAVCLYAVEISDRTGLHPLNESD